MPRTTTGSARRQILDALIDDHKEVKRLFREFRSQRHAGDRAALEVLVWQTCSLLMQHATLEEEVFYPALRGALKDLDVLDEASVEHAQAASLMAELHQHRGDTPNYSAMFTVLGEYVKHHIREEEGDLFQRLTRAHVDWDHLLDRMQSRRSELRHDAERASAAQIAEEEGDPVGAKAARSAEFVVGVDPAAAALLRSP